MINLLHLRPRLTRATKRYKILQKQGMKVGTGCIIYGSAVFGTEPYLIELGNNVHITSGCRFLTHDGGVFVVRHLYKDAQDYDLFGRIIVGNNVFIGNNSVILPNVKIGDNVIIGAGSIVTHDIPSNSVAAGVPCRVIHSIDEYYQKVLEKGDHTKHLSPQQKKDFLEKKYHLKDKN